MTKMLENDPLDLIAEDPVHFIEEIQSGVVPLRCDRRYISLLNHERVVVGELSCTSPARTLSAYSIEEIIMTRLTSELARTLRQCR